MKTENQYVAILYIIAALYHNTLAALLYGGLVDKII